MSTEMDLQRKVTEVFADAAPMGYPDELLNHVLSTTSRARPRPTWLADLKEPPMRYPARVVVGSPTLRLAFILALMLTLALVGAAAVAAAASLLPSHRLDPYGPARNGSLAYMKDGDIYLADADGSHPRAIIEGDTVDRLPSFSRDGTRILFGRDRGSATDLMIANANGTDVRTVTTTLPDWSDLMPSDQQAAELRMNDGHLELSIVDLDGSGRTTDVPLNGIDPYWWVIARPPDGRELILAGHPKVGSPEVSLYGIKPNGTGLRTIGTSLTTPSSTSSAFDSPVISPNGKMLAFWHLDPAVGGTAQGVHLHLRDLTSGADLPIPFTGSGTTEGFDPQFSPDGTMIAFDRPIASGSGQWQLFLGSVDGKLPAVPIGLDFQHDEQGGFAFSPDGTQIIRSAWGSTRVIDLTTGDETVLAGIDFLPSWQRLAR